MNKYPNKFEKAPRTIVREARYEDIDRLVELEYETFHDVYEGGTFDARAVRNMMLTRLSIAQELMIVGEVDGVVEGVMACQRSNKGADDVKSWEETTNNGTLVGTHVPDGKNFYIVNLAITKRGTEHKLFDQLTARMISRFVEVRGEEAQLLSRIPQFSQWLIEQGIDFAALDNDAQDALANHYVTVTKMIDGKERLYDGVLRRYVEFGVKPVSVLRDSYNDPSSHNYEVLCIFKNPLPETLKRNRIISRLAGRAIRYASNHPDLLRYLP